MHGVKQAAAAITLTIRNDPRYLPWLRAVLGALAQGVRPAATPARLWQAGLVLTEAVNNAMVHAHGRRTQRWIEVRIQLHARTCRFVVIDNGPGFALPRTHAMPSPEQCHGRGLPLIQHICHQCRVVRRGRKNYFTMVCHV